ncbi:MAG TPA: hypothetical protein PLU71_00740 [Candidatus Dependentiae bacterium]|nr:hypothetical protein [Candidatus Dependentiae bacterium]HRQ62363.1 hypothetical protein [Candidatus Dependentiae bacterium]
MHYKRILLVATLCGIMHMSSYNMEQVEELDGPYRYIESIRALVEQHVKEMERKAIRTAREQIDALKQEMPQINDENSLAVFMESIISVMEPLEKKVGPLDESKVEELKSLFERQVVQVPTKAHERQSVARIAIELIGKHINYLEERIEDATQEPFWVDTSKYNATQILNSTTCLSDSSAKSLIRIARILHRGANPSALYCGYTALHRAMLEDMASILVLVKLGKAHVDVLDNQGETPLLFPIQHADIARAERNIRTLLALGADPNKQDQMGMSVFMHAVQRGASEFLIYQFLRYGARVDLTCNHNKKARDYYSGTSDIIKNMLEHGTESADYQAIKDTVPKTSEGEYFISYIEQNMIWALVEYEVQLEDSIAKEYAGFEQLI